MDNFLNASAQGSPQIGIVPLTRAVGTTDGTGVARAPVIDNQLYLNAMLVCQTGVVTGTPTSFTVTCTIQDATTVGGTYANYLEPDPDGGTAVVPSLVVSAINSIGRLNVNLKNAREFIRVRLVTAFVDGTTPSINCSAALILMGGQVSPA